VAPKAPDPDRRNVSAPKCGRNGTRRNPAQETSMKPKHLSLFCTGLGAGVALAILFAPKSGRETRDQIRGTLEDGKRVFTDKQAALRDSAKNLADSVTSAIGAGRDAYRGVTQRVKNGVNDALTVG
jgi:gas vesicle protein